jgi:hypothetical protein
MRGLPWLPHPVLPMRLRGWIAGLQPVLADQQGIGTA